MALILLTINSHCLVDIFPTVPEGLVQTEEEAPPRQQFPTSDEISGCHTKEEQKGDLTALSALPPLSPG